jgi:3'(2'), 5'-bisphosphate nucleotidase
MGDGPFGGGVETLLDDLTTLVSEAAAAILTARATGLDPRSKADQSPVTAADMAAESVILNGLARLLPGVAVVSEESADTGRHAPLDDSFILVDPLDGTRELVAGRDEFTVNVAVMHAGRPALGIVSAPAYGLLWRGSAATGAERLRLSPGAPANAACERVAIRTRRRPASGLIAAISRSHLDAATEALLARLPVTNRLTCGSAIKFCRLAEGGADLYPRLSPTCEWDVAAGHAVLVAAGGAVTKPDGTPLPYGRIAECFRVPAFVAVGDPSAAITF